MTKEAKNAEGMTDLFHHSVVMSTSSNIVYNHNNPSGLKIQPLIRIIYPKFKLPLRNVIEPFLFTKII